jgi:uncharacterized MAPEG superfamily protein
VLRRHGGPEAGRYWWNRRESVGNACIPIEAAMTSPSFVAFTGFATWALLLLVLMEVIRTQLVLRGRVPANGFAPDNSNLSPFMQRLARAHANCVEGLPIFGGLLIAALATDRSAITDSLAYVFLGARVFQSLVHLASISPAAVTVRFTAFAVQMAIGVYWAFALLASAWTTGVPIVSPSS